MSTSNAPRPSGAGGALFSGQSFPEIYERALVAPLFDPWVQALFEDVHLKAGDRVLDIACGTGIVARRARERLGQGSTVVGVDVNPQMLAVARRVAPGIDWRDGDATSLPLRPDEQFDVILCQQGFQFFTDGDAAAREMRRASAAGGRVGVATWIPDEELPVLLELRRIAEEHVGPVADRRHRLGDPSAVVAALKGAGFRDVRARRVVRTIELRDGSVFIRLNATALVGMSDFRTRSDEDRQEAVAAIAQTSADRLAQRMDGGALSFELGTNIVLAEA